MSGVNSTLNLVRMADRMSVQQLQRSMRDGTLPGWIAVPRIAELNKMNQKAKMDAAAAQPKPPTVDQQVMQQAEADQIEAAGLDQLPVEVPVTMAGGGIVAFAEGDLVDEAAMGSVDAAGWSDEEKDLLNTFKQRMANVGEIADRAAEMGYSDVAAGQLQAGKKAGAYKGITGEHKYKDLIQSEAKRVGLDPEYALKIAMIESGGLKNPEAVRSKAGAIGIMQLMPATAKSLGVENPEDPAQNIRGGVGMLKRLVDKYGDYELAGAAYNAGEGRVDRALRSGKLGALPQETQGYMGKIRGMAEGGVTTIDPVTGEAYTSGGDQPGYFADLGDILPRVKRATGYGKMLPESERGWSPEEPKPVEKTTAKPEAGPAPAAAPAKVDKGVVDTTIPEPSLSPTVAKAEAGPDYRGMLYDRLNKMIDESAKTRESDKYMSLLAAGLGMMGGTSPYAAANIGQGAMQGIQAQLQAQKSQAEQEKNITGGILGLTRADLLEKSRADAIAERALARGDLNTYRKATLQGQELERQIKLQDLNLKTRKEWTDAVENWEKAGGKMALESEYVKQYGKNWRADPKLVGQFNTAAQQAVIGRTMMPGETPSGVTSYNQLK